MSLLRNKRRRDSQEMKSLSGEPPIKRRKKSSGRYRYSNNDNPEEEYTCFHFDTFKSLNAPHPCLYASCSNVVFDSWSDWETHWRLLHHQHYTECNQSIPFDEFNQKHPKIKESSFRHLSLITILGSEKASKWKKHCIFCFDLTNPNTDNKFNISYLREKEQLIWDPTQFKQQRHQENHCNPLIWDRIRSATHCVRHVPYYNNSRILFRCGGYYASNTAHDNDDDYNEMQKTSLSNYCDAFDIDNKQHFVLPNLPELVHSSSAVYISELECLLNIGGDDYDSNAVDHVNALFMNESIKDDTHLSWNETIFPNMTTKRSYRPSVGMYRDSQSVMLFVAGGCNTRYDGLQTVESLNVTPWINDIVDNNNNNKTRNWIKHKPMHNPRRDASNLLHWKSLNTMVCCGGDHGEGSNSSIKPWYTSEMFDFNKTKWIELPSFPHETSHAQTPFIWIEGGINDNNNWSGIRETQMFKQYSSFDTSCGVLCVIGNGFCTQELGIVSFYDPRNGKWQCGGNTQDHWLGVECNYIGVLDEKQELRTLCGV